MTTLELLTDCVNRARALPGVLEHTDPDPLFSDELLADLDLALEHCLSAIRSGEDMAGVLCQILQLKWLVYQATGQAEHYSARWDLHDSHERVIAARAG